MLRAATWRRGRSSGGLLVLAYHRVLPTVADRDYPYDIELVSADPEQFDWQMSWIARHFAPMAVSEIAACLERGQPLPAGAIAVTFDDGFEDNYTYAFPILSKWKVPACMFLSTDYIGTTRPYWFEAVAHVLMRAPVGSVRVPAIESRLPRADELSCRRDDIRSVLSALKRLPDGERRANLDALAVDFSEFTDAGVGLGARAMNWSQVGEMCRSGIEFGSHGTSHAVLSRLDGTELTRELTESRRAIENATGVPVTAIAYPVGGPESINASVIAAARAAGYRIGFTYACGSNPANPPDRLQLARQHVERYVDRAYFQGLITLPAVFD